MQKSSPNYNIQANNNIYLLIPLLLHFQLYDYVLTIRF